jgi:hypothetical protein
MVKTAMPGNMFWVMPPRESTLNNIHSWLQKDIEYGIPSIHGAISTM